MRRRRFKQVIAMFMAIVMVFGMNTMAFADPNDANTVSGASISPNDATTEENINSAGNSEQTTQDDSGFEGDMKDDIFQVRVPTSSNGAFRFIVDPQMLIYRSEAAAYPKTADHNPSWNFIDGAGHDWSAGTKDALKHTVFFKSTSGDSAGRYVMKDESDIVRIINYSSVSVDVAVEATWNTSDAVDISDNQVGLDAYTSPAVYMAFVSQNMANPGPLTADVLGLNGDWTLTTIPREGLNINDILKKTTKPDAYIVSVNKSEQGGEEYPVDNKPTTEHKYTYMLSANYTPSENNYNPQNAFYEYLFKLTGDLTPQVTIDGSGNATATDVSWAGLTSSDIPSLNIVWHVTPHGTVTSYLSSTTMTAANNTATLNLPDGVSVSKLELFTAGGSSGGELGATHYTISGTTLTVTASRISGWVSGGYTKIVVTYSDGNSDEISLS